jgi:glycosyltransferase involved in cell wall biosynthesis
VNGTRPSWICCHLGAREHYAVPRALYRLGRLAQLVTDAWVVPGTMPAWLTGSAFARLGQRHHPELDTAPVRAFTPSLVAHEALWRLQRRRDWDLFMARNRWFGERAADALAAMPDGAPVMVFAHSYAAEHVFREARNRGWTTVLGQIDPGPEHYALQQRLAASSAGFTSHAPAPPPAYFDGWRAECELADRIVVNSQWSRQSLVRAGVDAAKIHTVPLVHEVETGSAPFTRAYPPAFSPERPLRVLFVGTSSPAKGAPELLQALERLAGLPIELHVVGSNAMTVPQRFAGDPRIRWVGAVDRNAVMAYYRSSDVLVFPSHSEGFGMAQVEAQSWRLPIIASANCGAVVTDGVNGIVLREVSAPAIAEAIRSVAADPRRLAAFAGQAGRSAPDLSSLAAGLIALEGASSS